jgi:hypothetical protein
MKQFVLMLLCASQLVFANAPEKDIKAAFPKLLENKSLVYRPAASRWQGEELSIHTAVPWSKVVVASLGGAFFTTPVFMPKVETGLKVLYGAFGACFFGYAGHLYLTGRVKKLLFTLDSVGVKEHGNYVLKWNDIESVSTYRVYHSEYGYTETARYTNKMGVELWSYKTTDNFPLEFNEFMKIVEFFTSKYKKSAQA